MLIEIRAHALPGRNWRPDRMNIHVGIQHRQEVRDLIAGDADAAIWSIACTLTPSGDDVRGPHIQGRKGGRFIYLSWGTLDDVGGFHMFRRAKIMLGGIEPATLVAANRPGYQLVGSLGLTDLHGGPLCAAVRPPAIQWTVQEASPPPDRSASIQA